jgi:hypothetical protein
MKVVLTESQYRAILLNESRDEFTNYLSNLTINSNSIDRGRGN